MRMSALLLPAGLLGDKYGRKKLTIGDLYSMQWLVKGVVGSISKVPPP